MKIVANCDYCMYYGYDDDYECYTCEKDLDEDEMAHFMRSDKWDCPYFKFGDEYTVVKKQM